ncbi:MAG: hypothetical protein ACTSUS_07275 [Candidatus Freyarchaeota archaeon]
MSKSAAGCIAVSPPRDQVTLAPGESRTVEFRVENLGVDEQMDFTIKFIVTDALGIYKVEGELTGTLLVAPCELVIFTDGEGPPNSAKFYVNGELKERNAGSSYETRLPVGDYEIDFEKLEGYKCEVYVNDIKRGHPPVIVHLEAGQTKVVRGKYSTIERETTPIPLQPQYYLIYILLGAFALIIVAVLLFSFISHPQTQEHRS